MDAKITAGHLSRTAYVYIRQSTQFQVRHNLESQRRQYGLAERARSLGWAHVEVIDEDLGRSASGTAARGGFEKLVAAVCLGGVGAVFCIEASRLARNNREWHQLVDMCGLLGTLLIDHDGVYDPRLLNDRLLLGLKGTMSEMELGLIRQRSREAINAKIARGEYLVNLPPGYVKVDGRCEKHPDRRVRHAVALVFRKFAEFGSARQAALWFRQEGISVPVQTIERGHWVTGWRLPTYSMIHRMLTHPVYAGAYVWGLHRTETRVEEGRAVKRERRAKPFEEWQTLLKDRHAGYISWEQFVMNRKAISENAAMYGIERSRCASRTGPGILAGLLRCGRCGRRFSLSYGGSRRPRYPRYFCRGTRRDGAGPGCLAFSGFRADAAVERAFLGVLGPGSIEAAARVHDEARARHDQERQVFILALERARYEADRAFRQYDQAEPENRLVAAELEARWNAALDKAAEAQKALERLSQPAAAFTDDDMRRLAELGADAGAVWRHPRTDYQSKKRLLRTLIEEIIVRKDSLRLELVIHWKGGQHSRLEVEGGKSGITRHVTPSDVVELIAKLARVGPDRQVAQILNSLGHTTAHGQPWTQGRINAMRNNRSIPAHSKEESRGLVSVWQAARRLGLSYMSTQRLASRGVLQATQVLRGAPWQVREECLSTPAVLAEVARMKGGRRRKPTQALDAAQQDLKLGTGGSNDPIT